MRFGNFSRRGQKVAQITRWIRGAVGEHTKAFRDGLCDLVFPPQCAICHRELASDPADAASICAECEGKFSFGDREICVRCSLPLKPTGVCTSCVKRSYRFSETRALGIYKGLVQETVLQMKHVGQEAISLAMGHLLVKRLRECPFCNMPDLLVPTPMHWWRRLRRGTNCAELVAERLGSAMGRPIATDLIHFRRRTKKQGTLLPNERFRNMRRAFAMSDVYDIRDIRILLVDDVMTTGATSNAIAKMLLRAGANSVLVAVVARAVGVE